MFLNVNKIWVHYGKVEALKGVSFRVEAGSIVSLIGANGAGKSTAVKTISGVCRVTSGEIWFEDERIDKLSSQDIVKRGIVQVPEGKRLFPGMTVLDNLKAGAYLRKDKAGIEADLKVMFERFPILAKRQRQEAGTLSGGEQQMLAIARALMSRPKLLLTDEPSLGLAPILVGGIAKIISDINQNGTSILLVEQNANMALKLAHRGYVIQTGSVVLEGDTSELVNSEEVKKGYLGG